MNTKTITTRSIPLLFITKKKYSRSAVMSVPWKMLNITLIIGIVLAFIGQMLMVNYLNTGNLRLQELADREAILQSETSELNIAVLDAQSLETVTERARELGMTPDGNIIYLTTRDTSYVKR